MSKIVYYTFFLLALLPFGRSYAQQKEAQDLPGTSIESKIIAGKKVQLFEKILDRVIMNARFLERFQTTPPMAKEEWQMKWRQILGKDVPLFDKERKQAIIDIIKEKKLFPLQKVLENSVSEHELDRLLKSSIEGEIHHDESSDEIQLVTQTVEETLAKKAIKLVEAVIQINEDMKALKEAFEGLNEIVKEQGKQINEIEEQVSDAKQAVNQGKQHIQQAEKYQKNSYQIYYILLAISLLITLLGFIFFRRKRKK